MKFLGNLLLSILAVLAPIKAVMISAAVLVVADLILGIVAAIKRGEKITSAGFRRTISKLFVYEMAVVLGFICEKYLISGTVPLSKIMSAYIGLTEMKSIVENLDSINGKPIFKDIISKLGSQNDSKDNESDSK
jgi:phage-related holin